MLASAVNSGLWGLAGRGVGNQRRLMVAPQHLTGSPSGTVGMVIMSKMRVSRDLNYFLCKIILEFLFCWQYVAVSEDRGTLEKLGAL